MKQQEKIAFTIQVISGIIFLISTAAGGGITGALSLTTFMFSFLYIFVINSTDNS